jgi:polyhydroxybutyrate depolymerase
MASAISASSADLSPRSRRALVRTRLAAALGSSAIVLSCAEPRSPRSADLAPGPADEEHAASETGDGSATSAAPPPPGCGRPAPKSGARRVRVGSRERTYTLVVPESYRPDAPHPLVLGLHGSGGKGSGARAQLGLERAAPESALFVYPDGIKGGWDLASPAADNRDVAFFDALLLEITNAACVDPRRVFVAGFSNGAYMANQLACRRGDRIRAIATHAGGGPFETQGRYDEQGRLLCPGKAVAALIVHGASDRAVLPGEGQKSVDHWHNANRCGKGRRPGPHAACEALDGCLQPVTHCRVPGLGHAVWSEAAALSWALFSSLK